MSKRKSNTLLNYFSKTSNSKKAREEEEVAAENEEEEVEETIVEEDKSLEIFQNHQNCQFHKDSEQVALRLKAIQNNKVEKIETILDQQKRKQQELNQKFLVRIIEIIKHLARQNLPLRGDKDYGLIKEEEEGQRNPGNFRAELMLHMKFDSELKEYLTNVPQNAQYTSPRVQNELINLCGNYVKGERWGFFSVLVDEATDAACLEQLCLLVRYLVVEPEAVKVVVKEQFLEFIAVDELTGRALADTILRSLRGNGLDLENMVGQGYDGAAAMAGKHKGVQALIREEYPLAHYTHCASHSLNLACVTSCKVEEICDTLTDLQNIIWFFTYSPGRSEYLREQIQQLNFGNLQPKKQKLLNFCETRWVDRHRAIMRFKDLVQPVVLVLDALLTVRPMHHELRAKARTNLNTIKNFSFLLNLLILNQIATVMKEISVALQGTQIDLVKVCNEVESLLVVMRDWRQDDDFYNTLFEEAETLAAALDTDVIVPRRFRSQLPPKDFFRTHNFHPFIDHLIVQLETRFSSHQKKIYKLQGLIPAKFGCVPDQEIVDGAMEYEKFLDCSPEEFKGQVLRWKASWWNAENKPDTILKTIPLCDQQFYPLIFKVLHIFGTLPVHTANVERCFSVMRRTKTFLRTSMKNERFTGLSHICIHREYDIPPMEIVKLFTLGKRRADFGKFHEKTPDSSTVEEEEEIAE